MNERESVSLYWHIKELIQQCAATYESGLLLEIQDFLGRREDIQAVQVSWDTGGFYLATVTLKAYSYSNAQNVFRALVTFLEYGDATLYVRETHGNTVHYLLASLTTSGLHFYCRIDFL